MPTATTTLTTPPFSAQLPLKAGLRPSRQPAVAQGSTHAPAMGQTSTSATLRSLYNRATRAFVLKDIPTTHSLIQSAFALLKPPNANTDSLSEHRRKWDILRITFDSTVYATPSASSESLPESLRASLTEAPQALVTSIYNRSLSLFTPSSGTTFKNTVNAAFLPSAVLSTLVYCSLKLDAPDVGRVMIEDWLARREPHYLLDLQQETEGNDYGKVLELYCLHILPKVEQWEYAKEFLEYESELPAHRREHLKESLSNLYSQTMASRQSFKPPPTSLPPSELSSPRSYSPAPSSSSSSSSSLSTASTHTVVPATPRGPRSAFLPSGLTNLTQPSSSSASVSSDETATPRIRKRSLVPNGNGPAHTNYSSAASPRSKSRTVSSTSSAYSNLPRAQLAHQVSVRPAAAPSSYALIRASLAPYLTGTKVTTFLVLFVLVPLISFVLRMRRRKKLLGMETFAGGATAALAASSTSASNAELVRRRLHASGGGVEGGLFKRALSEVVRVVGDTVKMAGSGLV